MTTSSESASAHAGNTSTRADDKSSTVGPTAHAVRGKSESAAAMYSEAALSIRTAPAMTPRSELTAIPTNEPLEQVFVLGTELFGLDSFRRWLIQPAYGLNYDVPVDLFRTSEGQQRVLEELTRIVYGDLA